MILACKAYTAEEKYIIIFESLSTNQPVTEIYYKYGISSSKYQI